MTFSKLYIVTVCLFGLCLASCGADTDSDLISSAYASMAKVTGEATLDECPNGGVLLEAGIDSNGNGKLDPKEVNDTYPICHGENGTPGKDGEPCIAEAQNNGDFEVKCPGQEALTVATGANLDALKDELAALKKDIEALKANPLDGLTDDQLASLKGEKGNDGKDGKDGEQGVAGKDGKDGEQGVAGKDGVGIVLATLNDKQELVITLSDGTKFTSGSIKGDQGEPGKDGQKGEKETKVSRESLERTDKKETHSNTQISQPNSSQRSKAPKETRFNTPTSQPSNWQRSQEKREKTAPMAPDLMTKP